MLLKCKLQSPKLTRYCTIQLCSSRHLSNSDCWFFFRSLLNCERRKDISFLVLLLAHFLLNFLGCAWIHKNFDTFTMAFFCKLIWIISRLSFMLSFYFIIKYLIAYSAFLYVNEYFNIFIGKNTVSLNLNYTLAEYVKNLLFNDPNLK